jgi:hypothetical protein
MSIHTIPTVDKTIYIDIINYLANVKQDEINQKQFDLLFRAMKHINKLEETVNPREDSVKIL